MGKGTRDFLIFVFFVMVVKLSYMRSENPNVLRVDSEMLISVGSEMVYFDNGKGWRSGES